jgi:type II secretory pathway component PulF
LIPSKSYRDFLEDLRALLGSGVPVREALGTIEGAPGLWRGRLARDLRRRIEDGDTLGAAMAALPGSIPRDHAALVEAGERSGTLDRVLARLVERIDERGKLRGEILRGVAWPAFLLVVAVVLLPLYLLVLGNERLYLAIQAGFFIPAALLVGAFFFGIPGLARGTRARRSLERIALAVPGLGTFLREVALGRTFGLLGLLTEAGGSLDDSFRLAAEAAPLDSIRSGLFGVPQGLRRGKPLHAVLRDAGELRLRLAWCARIQAGEVAGSVDRVFLELEEELDANTVVRVRFVGRLLPALLILVVGAIVLKQALDVYAKLGDIL